MHKIFKKCAINIQHIQKVQRNYFIHLWTHIGAEFTQYVCRTPNTPGEDTLAT